MSGQRPGGIEEAQLYLRMLTASAPEHSLLDIRQRTRGRRFNQMFLHARDERAAQRITMIGQRADVYVGCALRVRPRGTREDVAPTALLWADCDDAKALAAARAFTPGPSMLVTSGGVERAHAYWALTGTLSPAELEDANHRLAMKLGADVRCADATRILRVPGTWNYKYRPPVAVELVHHTEVRHDLAEILAGLPPSDRAHRDRPDHRGSREQDPLHRIDPAHYVRLLTGKTSDREGKIACPFHQDDKPSLHVYPTPEQGWACYGCKTPDGKPAGGDIYTFASLLWGIPSKGSGFLDLRARLDDVFGVERERPAPRTASGPQPGEGGQERCADETIHAVER
jgi:hypothetical protein